MSDPSLPALAALVEAIERLNPMHRGFLRSALARTREDERERLERYLGYCAGRGFSTADLADCYLTLVWDTLREQIHFEQYGAYRYSTYAEVAAEVYNNDEYMTRYMIGLALTAFLWPNHLAMFRFFAEELPRRARGAYLEIGPGHGYYLMTAMQQSAYDRFVGIDVSATSLAETSALLAVHGSPQRTCELRCEDFLAGTLEQASYDAVVMGEVLEHVEEPGRLLDRIVAVARPGAWIYVTTCVNAPAVDHITLFRDVASVEALLQREGLRIVRSLVLPYDGKTLEDCVARKLAVNVAYVLERV